MNERIRELAEQAGAKFPFGGFVNYDQFDYEKFAELVRADEREQCAKVCEARYMGDNNREDMEARRCAEAIRARGIDGAKVGEVGVWGEK